GGFIRREDISGIEINSMEGTVVFERKGDAWEILKPAGLIPGETQINSLLSDISNLRCESYLDKNDLKGDPGFNASDAVTVSVHFGQRTAVLKIGGEKDSSNRFATIEGSGEFFSIANYNYNKFNKKPEDYRNKKIFGFATDDIQKIELAHPDETVEIERVEGEKKWKMTKPSENPNLKTETVDSIAGTIANLQVKEFVKGKSPVEVKLAKGCFEARVTTKSGTQHRLFISSEKKDNDNYARTTQQPFTNEIFTINTYQAKNIMKHAGEIIADPNLPLPK
ncbi:MAG: DUF4340 domain-containing protein, partial [Deltaproteobacteria bacterium]|nr:DUF4340 domain-containing protein [Deltaproteobacteria bacterium]